MVHDNCMIMTQMLTHVTEGNGRKKETIEEEDKEK